MLRTSPDAILLLWGLDLNPFPAALEQLLHQTTFSIRPVRSLHDAAAQFALLGPTRVRALLIDPLFLTSRNAPSLDLFWCHIPLLMLTLPASLPVSPLIQRQHILPWSETVQWIKQFQHNFEDSVTPDNTPPLNNEENAVTSTIEARYDELDGQPLLSAQEMSALLGAFEE